MVPYGTVKQEKEGGLRVAAIEEVRAAATPHRMIADLKAEWLEALKRYPHSARREFDGIGYSPLGVLSCIVNGEDGEDGVYGAPRAGFRKRHLLNCYEVGQKYLGALAVHHLYEMRTNDAPLEVMVAWIEENL